MEHAIYLSVALVSWVVGWMIDDKVMSGFAIGVALMVYLYNASAVTRWVFRIHE